MERLPIRRSGPGAQVLPTPAGAVLYLDHYRIPSHLITNSDGWWRMRVKVTINQSGINAACRQPGIYENLERRMLRVKSAAIASVNNRTYEYARGLKMERFRAKGGVAGVRLTATAGHSAVLEHGSRAHVIEAKNGGALFWAGAKHPVRKVHHPGTKAQHVLRNALKAAR